MLVLREMEEVGGVLERPAALLIVSYWIANSFCTS